MKYEFTKENVDAYIKELNERDYEGLKAFPPYTPGIEIYKEVDGKKVKSEHTCGIPCFDNPYWNAMGYNYFETKDLEDKKPSEAFTEYEQMKVASDKCYHDLYSGEEYCHKQSFLWGFEEGYTWLKNKLNKEGK